VKNRRQFYKTAAEKADALDGWIMRYRVPALCCAAFPASSALMLVAVFPAYASGLPFLIAITVLFLEIAYINRAADRRLRRAIEVLGTVLDPGPLLREARSQLELARANRPETKMGLLDCLAIAQVNSGLHQEAIDTFTRLTQMGQPPKIAYAKFMAASSRVFLLLKAGDAAGADAEIKIAEKLLEDSAMPKAFRAARADGLRLMKIRSRILRRDLDGVEDALLDFLNRFDKDTAKCLEIRFCLGVYYQAAGSPDKARAEFEFVCRNGGKLYLADEARLSLESLAAPVQSCGNGL
jgi:hypothetical protein